MIKDFTDGSPYNTFGYKERDLEGIPKGNEYCCPNCGSRPPDNDEGYVVDGEKYPKYYNEYLCSTCDGTTHDWDEVHKCPKCKTKFYFTNGCF